MDERKTALMLFQEDIDEAFRLWLDSQSEIKIDSPFTLRVRHISPWETRYELVPITVKHGRTWLEWRSAVDLKQKDLENALSLLLGKRNLGVEGGYWMSIHAGQDLFIAMIPHTNQQKFAR